MNLFNKKKETKQVINVSGEEGDAPWLSAQRQYEDRFYRLGAQVANWRLFGFICLLITAIAVCGLLYVAQQTKFVPMVFEVDKLGQTLAVEALTGPLAVTDSKRLVYREFFDLIENLRSVSTDTQANKDRITKGFSRLKGAARGYVTEDLKKALPNVIKDTKTVQVIVKSALKETEKTWVIEWDEHSFNLKGEEIGVERWKATVSYDLAPTGEEQQIRVNPIGMYVTEISWMKVL